MTSSLVVGDEAPELWERAVRDGHLHVDRSGRSARITYVAAGRTANFDDPEERVRAEVFAELIYVYGYEPSLIGVEVVVPDRVPNDRADLVVFRDESWAHPFAVIECKRDGISDGEFTQAIEQAAGNGTWAKLRADYVMVVAGTTRAVLDFSGRYGVFEREENVVADLPVNYGKPAEYRYRRGGVTDIRRVSKEQLITALAKCHQTLWGGGKLSPPAAFGELSKLMFVKISDEKKLRRVGDAYEFQIRTHEGPQRLADRVHALYEFHRKRDPDVFEDRIRADSNAIKNIVAHLEGLNLSGTDIDVKGVAFETFMDGFFKGDFGQYFTPREVIEFAVKMIKPTSDDVVLDPACGSGGFLLHALDAIVREADEHFPLGSVEHATHWRNFARSNLYGIEINEEITRVAKMNMILHEDGHTNIVRDDGLSPLENLSRRHKDLRPGGFTVVLSNPPFGAQVLASEAPWLEFFDMGSTDASGGRKPRRAQRTEILFIERIWQFLAPRGRAAIVLPDGVLANSSTQYVRDFIIDRFRILAVVSLPTSAFSHFGTTVKASLIFLQKRRDGDTPHDGERVFMAAAETVGYDATGREAPNQLPEILAAYEQFSETVVS